MASWKTLEHTADLALEGRGDTAAEALAALCQGLMAQITDLEAVRPLEKVDLSAEGLDDAEAVVGILGELLYWVNARGWLFREFRVVPGAGSALRLEAWGEPRDPTRQPFELEVKAATYHDLFWGPSPVGDGWRARVIFDV